MEQTAHWQTIEAPTQSEDEQDDEYEERLNVEIDKIRELKDILAAITKEAILKFHLTEADVLDAETRRRKIHNHIEDLKGAIRVFCRVRPLSDKEQNQDMDKNCVELKDSTTMEVPKGGVF